MIEVAIRVLGLNPDDPAVLETLETSMGVGMVEPHDEYAVVPFFVNEESSQNDVAAFVRKLRAALPGSEVVGLDSDLVNHTEIAVRVAVSREAVRLWAKEDAFPIPVSSVGPKGDRVYEWADVAHGLGARGRDPEAPGELPTGVQRVQLATPCWGLPLSLWACGRLRVPGQHKGTLPRPLSVPGDSGDRAYCSFTYK